MSHVDELHPDLADLLNALCEGEIDPDDAARLEQMICADPAACRLYFRYIDLHVELRRRFGYCQTSGNDRGDERIGEDALYEEHRLADRSASISLPITIPTSTASNPQLAGLPQSSFLSTTFHGTLSYFSEGMPLAYLLATVIFGVGLLVGSRIYVSGPEQLAGGLLPSTNNKATHDPRMPFVGRITGMLDCQWVQSPESGVQSPALGSRLSTLVALGDKFALSSGLMEITYDTGAKVILQGPATYEVESATGGFLSIGQLTAKVEKKAEGGGRKADSPLFAIRTPSTTVVDLGTEFGVEVNANGRADVHVFVGTVDCHPISDRVGTGTVRLTKDSSAAFAPDGSLIEQRQADRGRFTKIQMPRHRPLPLVGLYTFDGNAEDQSGSGNHVVAAKMKGITFVDGFEGQAAHFDAVGESFVDLPIDARPTAMPKLTWGAWVRPRTIGPNRSQILSTDIYAFGRTLTIDDRGGPAGDANAFRFAALVGSGGAVSGIFPSTGPLPQPNTWTFVAGTYNDSLRRVSLYVEDKSLNQDKGGLVDDHTVGALFGEANAFIRVGRHATMGEPFDGEIDNVFIFREVLSIKALELIRKHGVPAILALAKGEEMPEE